MAIVTSGTTSTLAGVITNPGTYVFTLRATDNANAGNVVDHTFTYRGAPMQLATTASTRVLAAGTVGSPYSYTFRIAGGIAPHSFSESPFLPLPPGLTLSSAGVLSGTPAASGRYTIQPIVTDASGAQFNAVSFSLVITTVGGTNPLTSATLLGVATPVAGAPFRSELKAGGGVAPITYSLAAGSVLPPGIAIFQGFNGVPAYLAGKPTTAGTYAYTLVATDAVGQSVSQAISQTVTLLGNSPSNLTPSGMVGSLYSLSLLPFGGTPPYTFQLNRPSDMPVGMSLTSAGLLSGTPAYPGFYTISYTLSDSAGNSRSRSLVIAVDNAAGQVPRLNVTPSPIQVTYLQGSSTPSPLPISVNTSSGSMPFTAAFSGIPGSTLSAGSGTTSGTLNLTLNPAGLGIGTYAGLFGVNAPLSANQSEATPVILTVAAAPPCNFSTSPNVGSIPLGGGAGSFDVTTAATCAWTTSISDPTWVTITSGASGTGTATVSYTVAPNVAASARNATISVAGQAYTIQQFGSSCSFSVSPANVSASAGGGSVDLTVVAANSACSWNATGLGASPSNGTGNGSVTLTIPQNNTPLTQVLTATVAGQLITVTQTGVNCTVGLSSPGVSLVANGGGGSVDVATLAGCSYATVPGPNWITVTSGGSGVGAGTLTFTVDANPATVPRSGTLLIGGQPFQIDQGALACSVTIDANGSGSPYNSVGGTGSISVTANGPNCSWIASSGATWASLTSLSGTGNGSVGVVVSSNAASAASRSTNLSIGGQSLAISQAGTACSYSLGSSSGTVPATGGSGTVGVVAPGPCTWTSTSNDPSWLSITSSGSGGSSTVAFVAQPNTGSMARVGTLTIAGQTYTVTQAGGVCSYALAQTGISVASTGGASGFGFSTSTPGCSPVAVSYAGWITVSTSFGGTTGSVAYSVAPNPSTGTRTGIIQVGDQNFTISQIGASCGFGLAAYGQIFSRAGGSGTVLGSPNALGCTPTTGTDRPAFISLGNLSGPDQNIFRLPFSVSSYGVLTRSTRSGTITFGGRIFYVKQNSW
ncbi:MAG: BACON domain-containing protein [Candidatus Solibacter usitatus]|nr:BACON domain-containing protein [Candidatus Solibacter usitatus]